jgi:hypothetical protein
MKAELLISSFHMQMAPAPLHFRVETQKLVSLQRRCAFLLLSLHARYYIIQITLHSKVLCTTFSCRTSHVVVRGIRRSIAPTWFSTDGPHHQNRIKRYSKLSLCLTKYHVMKTYDGVEVYFPHLQPRH